ncbi:MAG TPA: cupredoxin domain-containing protein [Sulfuriferula sp.]|nr:cupredoxin domain-containing protein [Sulfuriferula sp.]
MKLNSRGFKILTLAAVLGTGLVSAGDYASVQTEEPVIKIVAKKFDYTPNVIKLKKGVPVVLEFTTLDVVMGFKVPDLGVRADIIPGKVSRVRLVPDKVGTFPFLCDIFCGSGHEDMTGTIVVTD